MKYITTIVCSPYIKIKLTTENITLFFFSPIRKLIQIS